MTEQTIPPLAPLGAVEQGCLLFADITGYTKFIDQTEITHAQDVIGDLIETMLEVITPTFDVSRVEGDAIFAFAPVDRLNPTLVLDTVDSTYFAFRRRLRDVVQATTCPCKACHLMPQLDLKFFLHDGQYSVKKVGGFTELSGMDVIVLHRLAKGSAKEVTGGDAYALYTAAIVDQMGLDPAELDLSEHYEEFADAGRVDCWVQDMEARWQAEEASTDIVVTEDDAVYEYAFETPAPPQVVWDWVTNPERRLEWQVGVTGLISMTGGRPQSGSVNHCMHGSDVTIEHVLDWSPFDHVTLHYAMGPVADWMWSYVFEPVGEGTRMTLRVSDPGGGMWDTMKDDIDGQIGVQGRKLEELIAASLDS